jgi:hypothetical protein
MLGRHILPWLSVTVLTMVFLVTSALLALQVVMPLLADKLASWLASLLSAVVLLTGPWLAWVAGKRWIDKKETI